MKFGRKPTAFLQIIIAFWIAARRHFVEDLHLSANLQSEPEGRPAGVASCSCEKARNTSAQAARISLWNQHCSSVRNFYIANTATWNSWLRQLKAKLWATPSVVRPWLLAPSPLVLLLLCRLPGDVCTTEEKRGKLVNDLDSSIRISWSTYESCVLRNQHLIVVTQAVAVAKLWWTQILWYPIVVQNLHGQKTLIWSLQVHLKLSWVCSKIYELQLYTVRLQVFISNSALVNFTLVPFWRTVKQFM